MKLTKPGVSLSLPALLPLLLALGGCAGQMAYRDGQTLVAHDQIDAGLAKFQEAIAADPLNAQYKATWLTVRDRDNTRHLNLADRQLAAGRPELALQEIQRVLAIDPQNERARSGLRQLEMDQRHSKLLAEAQAAIDAKQYEPARQRLNAILTERPAYEPARALQHKLAELTAPPPVESALSVAYRQPISIEFRDAPLKQVFEVIARRSGLNFVFDKDVKTDVKASIYLKNSTVESAIFFLLTSNQLEQQVMDANTIMIYPNVAAKNKEYQEMVVKTFFLANAEAKLVANTLKTILKSRDVVVDEKLNLLIVRDSPEAIRLAERLVNLQDVPEPEVMLDVEILEIQRNRMMDLGIAWPTSATLTPLTTAGGTNLTLADLDHLNRGTLGVSSLAATLNANKTDGDSNLLANPRIRVRNKEKAKILIGDKVPVITSTVSGGVGTFVGESVSYIDVGLTLNAEPTIYLNNEVAIRIALEVSNIAGQTTTSSGSIAYRIGTRQASTMLQLKDGENQVLAGLINSEDRSSGSKVPGVGDLPVLGRLFGSGHDENNKTEIVLSITPHIVRNVLRPEALSSEFSAGTEGNFRRRPDLSAKAPAQLPGAVGQRAPAPGQVMTTQGAAGGRFQPSFAQPVAPEPAEAPESAPQTVTSGQAAAPAPPPAGAASPLQSSPVTLSSGQPVPVQATPLPPDAPAPALTPAAPALPVK